MGRSASYAMDGRTMRTWKEVMHVKKARVLGLSFLLAAAVAVPMTAPTLALAEDNDAALGAQPVSDVQPVAAGLIEVNGVEYGTLEDALAAVPADQPATVKLLGDVTIPDGMKLTIATDVTVVLNGRTLKSLDSGDRPIYVKASGSIAIDGTAAGSAVVIDNPTSYGLLEAEMGADITVKGGTYTGDTNNGCLFRVIAADNVASKVLLEGLTVETNGAVFNNKGTVLSSSKLELAVIGGTYTSSTAQTKIFYTDTMNRDAVIFEGVTATCTNGQPVIEIAGSDATFRDCNFAVNGVNANNYSDTAIFVGYMGKATIESGTYTSKGHGAYIGTSGGEIEVTGGTVQGDKGSIQADADGETYANAESIVTIKGGTIEGNLGGVTHGKATSAFIVTGGDIAGEFVLKENGTGGDASASVSGGTFNKPVPEDMLAPDCVMGEPDENGNYTVHKHEWATDLSFDETGHWYSCTKCDAKDSVASHEAAVELVGVEDASCGKEGYTGDKVCKDCGYVLEKGQVVPATGKHAADEWTANTTDHWHVCTVCSKPYDIGAHQFGEWTIVKEATATGSGTREHICTVCGKVVSETIPAEGVVAGPGSGSEGQAAKGDVQASKVGSQIAKTNDASMTILVGVVIVAIVAVGLIAFALLKRRNQR